MGLPASWMYIHIKANRQFALSDVPWPRRIRKKKSTARMWIPYVGWFRRLRCKGSEDVWDKGHVRYDDKVLSATLRVEGSDGFLNT